MAYRNIVVESPARISVKNGQITITTDETHSASPEDIAAIMLGNRQAVVTAAALAICAQNGIALFVCDEQHMPCGVMTPYSAHSRQLRMLRSQLAMSLPTKKQLWQQLVVGKINNQSRCLELCGNSDAGEYLRSRAGAVKSGDTDNMEAVAAAFYFPQLFGKGFVRHESDGRNAALNYGYAILRGAIARALAVHGFTPCLGIHHCSELNAFNLADDLIEPFRPLVDLFVVTNVGEEAELTPELKRYLLNLLNYDILYEGRHCSAAYAIELIVQSLIRCTMGDKRTLPVPELIELAPHRYE